jgi:hypothetical protein
MSREGAAEGRITMRALVGRYRELAKNQAAALSARGDLGLFDVTMLGSTGTGKTTLLASMYERFDEVIGRTDLAFVPEHLTSVKLNEYITYLRSMPQTLTVKYGLPGTGDIREYLIGVGRKGRQPVIKLRFTDYPGKYLISGDVQSEEKETVLRALTRADVILVAIDAPALMERNGRYHHVVNQPQLIRDQIKRILMGEGARLIILAPLKCEYYVGTEKGARELTARVLQAYEPMLNFIRSGEVQSRVACVLAPAQTVGSVVFSTVTEDTPGQPVFNYHSLPNASYQPVDTDQPLRYALRFIVNKYRMDKRWVLQRIWQTAFGTDAALVAAVDKFAAGCKEDAGFQIIQNHAFLQPGG